MNVVVRRNVWTGDDGAFWNTMLVLCYDLFTMSLNRLRGRPYFVTITDVKLLYVSSVHTNLSVIFHNI